MATTYLQAINKVLRNLREETVTTLAADYTLQIGDYVNQAKEEVDRAAQWTSYYSVVSDVTISANAFSGTITGTDDARSTVWRDPATGCAFIFDITDSSDPIDISNNERSLSWWTKHRYLEPNQTVADVNFWAVGRTSDNDSLTLYTWPAPSAEKTVQIAMWIPAGELTATTDEILVPSTPIILGATWFALLERGEELGQNPDVWQKRYQASLAFHVKQETGNAAHGLQAAQLQPR